MRCAPLYGAGVLRAMLHRLRMCRTWRGRVHNVVPHAWAQSGSAIGTLPKAHNRFRQPKPAKTCRRQF
eukprot:8657808-Alexandrium_andersonii.AAC.1